MSLIFIYIWIFIIFFATPQPKDYMIAIKVCKNKKKQNWRSFTSTTTSRS